MSGARHVDDRQWAQWVTTVLPDRDETPETAPPLLASIARRVMHQEPRKLPPSAWADPGPQPTICQQNGRHCWSPLKPTCVLCGERP